MQRPCLKSASTQNEVRFGLVLISYTLELGSVCSAVVCKSFLKPSKLTQIALCMPVF